MHGALSNNSPIAFYHLGYSDRCDAICRILGLLVETSSRLLIFVCGVFQLILAYVFALKSCSLPICHKGKILTFNWKLGNAACYVRLDLCMEDEMMHIISSWNFCPL